MARKFIIVYDEMLEAHEIIMGDVEYHEQLIQKSQERKDVLGGGRWEWNKELYGDVLFIYGLSQDFGPVTKEQFFRAWPISLISPSIENCKVIFSKKEYFSDVLKEYKML